MTEKEQTNINKKVFLGIPIYFEKKEKEEPHLFHLKGVDRTTLCTKATKIKILIASLIILVIVIVIGSVSQFFFPAAKPPKAVLIHSWSLSDYEDSVGSVTLTNASNTTFISSRYGFPNAAISFRNGSLQIPPGDYINPDFSVSAWVNPNSNKSFTNLVSFSNQNGNDSIWIGFQNLKLYIEIQPSKGNLTTMTAIEPVQFKEWQHITFTLKSGIGYIYYNGKLQNSATLSLPTKIKRKFNFIGQDYYNSTDYLADAALQNLYIYKGALTSDEVMLEYETEDNKEKSRAINWQQDNSAIGCSFSTAPLLNLKSNSFSDCSNKCFYLQGCTHYSYIFGEQFCKLFDNQVTDSDVIKQFPTRSYGCGLTNVNIVTILNSYVGCFNDDQNKRDISDSFKTDTENMTLIRCFSFCFTQNYKYAALQNGNQCYCGNSYGNYGLSNKCNMICSGNSTQICGGNTINSVYDVRPPILINYWPMDSQITDNITRLNLILTPNPKTSMPNLANENDRFSINSATISLTSGYLKAPTNVYFNGDFSITAWIRIEPPGSTTTWEVTLLDFGNNVNNQKPIDDVIFGIKNGFLNATIFQGSSFSSTVNTTSGNTIQFDTWYHVAITFGGSTGYLYLNGKQIGNNTNMKAPLNVNRTVNIIGKITDNFKVYLDELKIFSGSLNSDEVYQDYNPGTLLNYWPLSNTIDVVGVSNINGTFNNYLDYDRFYNPNSATYLNNGSLTIPPGVYFAGDFSVSFWINFKSLNNDTSIFEFGNDGQSDIISISVLIYPDRSVYKVMILGIDSLCSMYYNEIYAPAQIINNKWYFIAFVLRGNTGFFYIDGLNTYSNTICSPNLVFRKINQIGNSSNQFLLNLNGTISDFKIYNKALLSSDISVEFKQKYTVNGISWNNGGWAENCDFASNDLLQFNSDSVQTCTDTCTYLSSCTHFTFSNSPIIPNCKLKYGAVSKTDAKLSSTITGRCGIISPNPLTVTGSSYGCFRNLSLTGSLGYTSSMSQNSIQMCNTFCFMKSKRFAVIDFGSNCNCINLVNSQTQGDCSGKDPTSYTVYNINLVNYWSFSNDLNDAVGQANIIDSKNNQFVTDRFCNLNGAVFLDYGYLQAPTGVYFSGDFTILTWIKSKQNFWSSTIFNFGNNQDSATDIVVFRVNNGHPKFITDNFMSSLETYSFYFNTDVWYHIGLVLQDKNGSIYVNGKKVASGPMSAPKNVQRNFNYFGRSSNEMDSNAVAIYDEMKIYSIALNNEQISYDYLSSFSNGKLPTC